MQKVCILLMMAVMFGFPGCPPKKGPETLVQVPFDQAEARSYISDSIVETTFPLLFRFPNEEDENQVDLKYQGFNRRFYHALNMGPLSYAFQKEAISNTCQQYYEDGANDTVTGNTMSLLRFWKDESFGTHPSVLLDAEGSRRLYSFEDIVERIDSSRNRERALTLPILIDIMNFLESRVPEKFFVDLPSYNIINDQILLYAETLREQGIEGEEAFYSPDLLGIQKSLIANSLSLMEEFQQVNIFDFTTLLELNQMQGELSEEEKEKFNALFWDAMRIAKLNDFEQNPEFGEFKNVFTELHFVENSQFTAIDTPDFKEGYLESLVALAQFSSTFDMEDSESSIHQLCGDSAEELDAHYDTIAEGLSEVSTLPYGDAAVVANDRRHAILKLYNNGYQTNGETIVE